MANDIIVPPTYPVPTEPRMFVRNGLRPNWIFGQRVAQKANHAIVYRRKTVFHKGLLVGSSTITTSQVKPWRWRFRTGYCGAATIGMFAHAIAQGTNATLADGPFWYIEYVPVGGGGTITSGEIRGGRYLNGAIESPSTLRMVTSGATGLAPNTVYEAALVLDNNAWVLGMTVYEVHVIALDESSGNVCPERVMRDGADLVYQDEDKIRDTLTNLHSRNGSHQWNWCTDLSTDSRTTTSATYVNLLDTAVTAVDASSRGGRMQGQYHDSQASSGVEMVIAAYGLNPTASAGKVALVDAGGTIAEVTLPTSVGWASTAFTYSGMGTADTKKADLHFKSNGSDTSTVYAVSIYEEV